MTIRRGRDGCVTRRAGLSATSPRPTGRTAMIVIVTAIIGAALGWRRAGQLGGNRRDRVQYSIAFGLGFAMIGLFTTIIVHRMA